jgi:hypothetical protein
MTTLPHLRTLSRPVESADCGIPLDSQYFDDSRFEALPAVGATALLARVELPPQYCGVLEYFSQYTDLFGVDPTEVETPGLRWQVLANRQPLSPYHQLAAILNPWGFGSFQFSLRLPEGAVVELIVRRIATAANASGKPITRVGGRLLGRFWYNPAYGSAR